MTEKIRTKKLNALIKKIEKMKDKSRLNQLKVRIIRNPPKHHYQQGIELTCKWILIELKEITQNED